MKGDDDEKCLRTKVLAPGADELYEALCELVFRIKTLFALHRSRDPTV